MVHMKKELSDNETLKTKVLEILNKLKVEGKKSLNATDSDCAKMHSRQGSHAGYNVQSVVDEKHGLIVSSDVVNENNDINQFAEQIEQAHETLDKKCQTACADAGYSNAEELERVDKQGIKVIVPSKQQAGKKAIGQFDKSAFKYIVQEDVYICPAGQKLPYKWNNVKRNRREYIADLYICRVCGHFGLCTKGKNYGRRINRNNNERFRDRMRDQYLETDSQQVYARRKQKVELPFGHIKHNLKVNGFLLRGFAGVKAEMSILSSCFNITRMIGIVGVTGLIAKLGC
jgi:hypothetical protein